MAAHSSIEWTDSSWTPIRARLWEIQNDGSGKERIGWHCEHASEGCRFCYAESINIRLGTGVEFKPGMLRGKPGYYGDGNDRPELFLDEKMLLAPLKWKKPRKIFVCSMTDLFASFVPDEWIDKMFAVMALCPQHTFQVLTKRADRMQKIVSRIVGLAQAAKHGGTAIADEFPHIATSIAHPRGIQEWPLPNVWLGISAERQQEWDERIPLLLQTQAAVRFVSAEPLLGPIDMACRGCGTTSDAHPISCNDLRRAPIAGLDWVIVGGESGPHARPMDPQWARGLRDQCSDAGVPYFFKQHGEYLDYIRVGKKAAGRLLDGVEHSAFPSGGAF